MIKKKKERKKRGSKKEFKQRPGKNGTETSQGKYVALEEGRGYHYFKQRQRSLKKQKQRGRRKTRTEIITDPKEDSTSGKE